MQIDAPTLSSQLNQTSFFSSSCRWIQISQRLTSNVWASHGYFFTATSCSHDAIQEADLSWFIWSVQGIPLQILLATIHSPIWLPIDFARYPWADFYGLIWCTEVGLDRRFSVPSSGYLPVTKRGFAATLFIYFDDFPSWKYPFSLGMFQPYLITHDNTLLVRWFMTSIDSIDISNKPSKFPGETHDFPCVPWLFAQFSQDFSMVPPVPHG